MNKIEYDGLIAFHPGYYVQEMIDSQGIDQEDLAKKLQSPSQYVDALLDGGVILTEDMAKKLAGIFGTSAKMWMNLNEAYLAKKMEIEERQRHKMICINGGRITNFDFDKPETTIRRTYQEVLLEKSAYEA